MAAAAAAAAAAVAKAVEGAEGGAAASSSSSSSGAAGGLPEAELFVLPESIGGLEALHTWDHDFLSLEGRQLQQLAASIFRESGLLDQFHVRPQTLAAFLDGLCANYHANPYHNFQHAVHVLHGVFMCVGTLPAPPQSHSMQRPDRTHSHSHSHRAAWGLHAVSYTHLTLPTICSV
eukprot:4472800-Prymnesium_polylepis.1